MAAAKRKSGVKTPGIVSQQYEMVPLDQIQPHPRNVRQGDIGAICESIKANGFYRPIVVQRSTAYILAGNHAYRAGVQMGLGTVPVVWLDCDDETALRILLVDNRTNDLASYDNAALAEILQEAQQISGSLQGTGFDGDALDEIITDLKLSSDVSSGGNPSFDSAFFEEAAVKGDDKKRCPTCGAPLRRKA